MSTRGRSIKDKTVVGSAGVDRVDRHRPSRRVVNNDQAGRLSPYPPYTTVADPILRGPLVILRVEVLSPANDNDTEFTSPLQHSTKQIFTV